ncbi:hypothetical protein NDU88_001371 [Pleurodeles waltl]|uniref:Uncharacterized protein n=1 Tax=Pleurodeles waltl TaxID=8319 RepID=A0AAV7P8I1_PLEWA|nr:hypothetical protein NDU88_001371 [Pleurodeles waltl]
MRLLGYGRHSRPSHRLHKGAPLAGRGCWLRGCWVTDAIPGPPTDYIKARPSWDAVAGFEVAGLRMPFPALPQTT